jgi:hypothetical protein
MELSNEPVHKFRRGALYSAAAGAGAALGGAYAQHVGLPADADLWSRSAGDAIIAGTIAAPMVTNGIIHAAHKVSNAIENLKNRNLGRQFD